MSVKFGQHFLVNQSALKKIADALDAKKDDVVIEIGAGHGELTGELVNWLIGKNGDEKLILIEKDNILVEHLKEKYKEDKRIEIINGDVLKILPKLIHQLTNQPINYKLVGNIPYYITGHLLRIIGELENKPERVVFTLQKEVAERLCAQPKRMNPVRGRPRQQASATSTSGRSASNGMNRLAASVQFWAKPEIIGFVPKEDFEPQPEVDSAIVTLTRIHADDTLRHSSRLHQDFGGQVGQARIDADEYYRAVRILFQQPRKTILNNFVAGNKKIPKKIIAEELQKIGVSPDDRPQNLSIEDITAISLIVSTTLN